MSFFTYNAAGDMIVVRQDVSMEVAEIPSVLERENAPPTVIIPSVGTGRSGEEDRQLPDVTWLPNDLGVRRNGASRFHGLEKDAEVVSLRAQTLQLQTQ